jgi:hypothetical protein
LRAAVTVSRRTAVQRAHGVHHVHIVEVADGGVHRIEQGLDRVVGSSFAPNRGRRRYAWLDDRPANKE